MKRSVAKVLIAGLVSLVCLQAGAESKLEYQNRFRMMLDFAVRTNEYVRQHRSDKSLASYAAEMAALNARAAERMTPPRRYTQVHPHFLLVLENIERSFFFASQGKLDRYRHHQKVVRKELHMLESLAEREGLELYLWRGDL